MKITFYSNFLNHHQLPFCKEMYSKLGDNFKFIATEDVPQERLDMGYDSMNKKYPFVITTYDSEENQREAMKLCIESDVMITGSCPEIYTKTRIKKNKLTFRYSERVYKSGLWRVLSPRGLYYMLKKHTIYRNKNLYMLCASAYTAGDFSMVGAYKGKTYKWGYFPEVKTYDIEKLLAIKSNDIKKILWCARFLELKHPEKAIYVAKRLKAEGYKFKLEMIGIGEKKDEIEQMIEQENLIEYVELLGSMSPEQVREYMEKANIFLFTSDYNEGWGAVLNEAMNSGCAIIASHAIGSVPFLIENGQNGLIYKNDDDESLYQNVKKVIDNKSLETMLGKNAYNTLNNTWNAKVAASRFIELSNNLINNRNIAFDNGPCSISKSILQWNMFKECIKEKR